MLLERQKEPAVLVVSDDDSTWSRIQKLAGGSAYPLLRGTRIPGDYRHLRRDPSGSDRGGG
jgi:hypothetical protein